MVSDSLTSTAASSPASCSRSLALCPGSPSLPAPRRRSGRVSSSFRRELRLLNRLCPDRQPHSSAVNPLVPPHSVLVHAVSCPVLSLPPPPLPAARPLRLELTGRVGVLLAGLPPHLSSPRTDAPIARTFRSARPAHRGSPRARPVFSAYTAPRQTVPPVRA